MNIKRRSFFGLVGGTLAAPSLIKLNEAEAEAAPLFPDNPTCGRVFT